jgi:hypothetical protein
MRASLTKNSIVRETERDHNHSESQVESQLSPAGG